MTISVAHAEDILWGADQVAMQEVSQHRWYTKRLIVFSLEGKLMGFYFLDPATEEQEGMEMFEADPVPVFPVVGREVTRIVYEPEAH